MGSLQNQRTGLVTCENSAHMCAMIRVADIYVLMAHRCGGCVQDAFGRAELLFSVDQACIQSASHRLVTVGRLLQNR